MISAIIYMISGDISSACTNIYHSVDFLEIGDEYGSMFQHFYVYSTHCR